MSVFKNDAILTKSIFLSKIVEYKISIRKFSLKAIQGASLILIR